MGCTSNKHQKQNSTNHDNCMYAQWVKNRLLAFKKTLISTQTHWLFQF